MVQSANALVCNVRPKATQRPGRGYEVLVGVNRNLVLFALLVRGIAVDGAVPLGAG
jgi:crotonobetainyl-CoA:carnitine CoA-transferase CaiB-like acyl-CoA transferase